MSLYYNVDYFYPSDTLYQLSKHSGKTVMYIKAIGPNLCENLERKREIWDFYYGKCDETILSSLRQNGEIYCYFLTEQQAIEAFHEWFPQQSYLEEDEMDFYFYVRLVNAITDVEMVNGNYEETI